MKTIFENKKEWSKEEPNRIENKTLSIVSVVDFKSRKQERNSTHSSTGLSIISRSG